MKATEGGLATLIATWEKEQVLFNN